MSYYDLTSFCNTIFYFPPNDVALSATEDAERSGIETTLTEAVKQDPKAPEELTQELGKLSPEKQKDIKDILGITNFNLTTDDVAIIALLTAFLAVINGPGVAITFGAFLAIAAGLDSKFTLPQG